MIDNSLDAYENVRDLAERAVEEALKVVYGFNKREKILDISSKVSDILSGSPVLY